MALIGIGARETPLLYWLTLLVSAGAIFVLNSIAHCLYARRALAYFEGRPPFQISPVEPDPLAEPIEFTAPNGSVLRGAVLPYSLDRPRGVLVFCPESRADFWSFQKYVPAAHLAGFDIVSFDFQSSGLSDQLPGYQPLHWATVRERDDLHLVLDHLRSIPRFSELPVVLHGVSRGGTVALHVAGERTDVSGVVAQSAFACRPLSFFYTRKWIRTLLPRAYRLIPDWHVRVTMWLTRRFAENRLGAKLLHIEKHLGRLARKPLFWICAERDSWVPPEVALHLFDRTGHPADDLWIAPKARHNGERIAQTDEYDQRLVGFLNRVVNPSGPQASSTQQAIDPANETAVSFAGSRSDAASQAL